MSIIQWIGGVIAYSALGIVLYGVWRGTQREGGRTTGFAASWLRSWWFYLACTILFSIICYFGWIPIPLEVSSQLRAWMTAIGSIFYFPGMILIVWGRLTLGKNYFVSTGFGAQLFAGHQLITSGPYAIVRHPMYAGLMLAAIGSLMIYMTWTTVYFACFAPLLIFRARREEQALVEEFGDPWREYCKRVPALIPKLWN